MNENAELAILKEAYRDGLASGPGRLVSADDLLAAFRQQDRRVAKDPHPLRER